MCISFKAPEAQKFLEESQSVYIPFPKLLPVGSKLLLAYSKPTNINVVGSYARKTSVLLCNTITIDMAVTMPSVSRLSIRSNGFSKTVTGSVSSERLP